MRELQNALERAAVLSSDGRIGLQGLPPAVLSARAPAPGSRAPTLAAAAGARVERSLAEAIGCYASVGGNGCGWEHQLASIRAALDGCETDVGCKQRQNAGFFRKDAYLAIIVLTDEDDCSAPPNSTLFDPTQTTLASVLGPLTSYRRFEFGNLCGGDDPGRAAGPRQDCEPGNKDQNTAHQLAPTQDFATFIKALKPWDPRLTHVSVIAGPATPVDVVLNANGYPDLLPSCSGDIGPADPSPRLTELVRCFDSYRARFISICDADALGAMDQIGSDLVQMMSP